MLYAYIQEPVVSMRESPSQQAKVVSQTLFAEKVNVAERKLEWSHISTPDGYWGWIPSSAIAYRETPYKASHHTTRLTAHLYACDDIEYGPLKTLPYGVSINAIDVSNSRWIKMTQPDNTIAFIQKGDVAEEMPLQTKIDLIPFSSRFTGLPYTWGGRSSFGYDCSGFVQMLYQKIGIQLERDAHQQAQDKRFATLDPYKLEPGDLLFFGFSLEQIKHVGLAIGNDTFIHATSRENQPWIRVSSLSDFVWSGCSDALYPCRFGRQFVQQSSPML